MKGLLLESESCRRKRKVSRVPRRVYCRKKKRIEISVQCPEVVSEITAGKRKLLQEA